MVPAGTGSYELIALIRVSLELFSAFHKKSSEWLKRWGKNLQTVLGEPVAMCPPLLMVFVMTTLTWCSPSAYFAIYEWGLLQSSTQTFLWMRDSVDFCNCWVLMVMQQNHRWNRWSSPQTRALCLEKETNSLPDPPPIQPLQTRAPHPAQQHLSQPGSSPFTEIVGIS